ncbi:bacterial extracellular solute-binding proteins, family 5 [Clostridium botulinum C str. Eklund]|nr:bacterial extracellular solute-binding proteins, family 5 [Clostridium botulinum C str. Eklund]NEZ49021.1 peptide ABC transporter substrate-binding protein [Clostridium botulinum]
MKKELYILVVVILLVFGIFFKKGCITKKVYNESVRDYLVYSINSMPKDLLLLDDNNIRDKDLQIALFEGLVSMDEKGKIVPGLAREWKISKDKLSYTFTIREDAKWNTGDKIVPQDFVDFFSRILKEQNNTYINELQCIFGVKEYIDGKRNFDEVAISLGKDNTLEIRLNYPCDDFIKILSQPVFTLKRNFYNLKNWRSEYKNIDYSGPYFIENIYDDGEVSLRKNNMYWDKKNVASNKIHIKEGEVTAFTLAQYKSNRVDVFCDDNILQDENRKNGEEYAKKIIGDGVSLNFNLNKNNFVRDIKFRKAIKYFIDKEQIKKELGEVFKETSSYVPNSTLNLTNKNYSIKSGEELLKDSKYNGEVLKLIYLNNEDKNKKIIDSIERDLKKAKVNVDIKGYNKEELKNIIYKDEYDMVLLNYNGDYTMPITYLQNWISNSKQNSYGYKNINFDNLVLMGKICQNKLESQNNFNKGERILLDDIATIPLGFYDFTVCKKEYVEGLEVNGRGSVILKKAYILDKNKTSH